MTIYTLHVRSPDMDYITCKNITVGLVKGDPLRHQTLHFITIIQPTNTNQCSCNIHAVL